jgi:hypothetical protein
MRILTIAEALNLEPGEKVPALRGKIVKIFDRSSGNNEHGDWSIQNLELIDASDPKLKLKVKVFDREDIPRSWTNKTIYIESGTGEKGIKGCEIKQDTYRWTEGQPIKKLLEVKTGSGAAINPNDQVGQPAQNSPAPAPAPAPPPSTAPPAQTAAAQPPTRPAPTGPTWAQAGAQMSKIGDVMACAISCVCLHVKPAVEAKTDYVMPPDHLQGAATALFIQFMRDHGSEIPATPFPTKHAEAKSGAQ